MLSFTLITLYCTISIRLDKNFFSREKVKVSIRKQGKDGEVPNESLLSEDSEEFALSGTVSNTNPVGNTADVAIDHDDEDVKQEYVQESDVWRFPRKANSEKSRCNIYPASSQIAETVCNYVLN